jgi:AcrR family transcriptional regulator
MPETPPNKATQHAAKVVDLRLRLAEAVYRLQTDGATYAETSVDRLVAEAGISRSTFYKYFKDKSGLLNALSEEILDDLLRASTSWLDLPARPTTADYRAALAVNFAVYRKHAPVLSALTEGAAYDEVFRARADAMMTAFIIVISTHISRGQAAGSVDPALDARATGTWLTWMLERGQALFIGPATSEELERYVQAAADVMTKSLHSASAR